MKIYRVELTGYDRKARQWTKITWIAPGKDRYEAVQIVQGSYDLRHVKEERWRTSAIGKNVVYIATRWLGRKRPS